MVSQTLDELTLIAANSITNIDSLFLYGVQNGTPYKVSGRTLSTAIIGTPKFATIYRASSIDVAPNTDTIISWTHVRTDTYGLADASSNTLFRIPDSKIKAVQLGVGTQWQNSIQRKQLRLNYAGLSANPGSLQLLDDHNVNTGLFQNYSTPVIEVQSGAHFWLSVEHQTGANIRFEGGNYCWFSIWAVETA